MEIKTIDIGNYGSAFVEVMVGSSEADAPFVVRLSSWNHQNAGTMLLAQNHVNQSHVVCRSTPHCLHSNAFRPLKDHPTNDADDDTARMQGLQ